MKGCPETRDRGIRRQNIKDLKPFDGRVIIENGVMKKERWAGGCRRGVEWSGGKVRERARRRRLHLSAKTSPITSTSQYTSESCLLD